MALTYELLLDLYRGRSTAVEQITGPGQLDALAIETPIGRLLRDLDAASEPRHVVLTGSAGDGKTFAALTARTTSFRVITDASARRAGIDAPPIDDLANQIGEALERGRLLLAINRGQLERLFERVGSRGGPLGEFVNAVRLRTVLRDTWGPPSKQVAVADLGRLDRAATAAAIVKKVSEMSDDAHLSYSTRVAFRVAREALKDERVSDWIKSIVRTATAAGANVTMRQLWSFVSFLATGARAPTDARILSLSDAVGARMFDPNAEGTLFDIARERCDPALTPNAKLARDILDGTMATKVKASGLVSLVSAQPSTDGKTVSRVAVVHGLLPDQIPAHPRDEFAEASSRLLGLPPGPQPLGAYPRSLLKGVFRALGLWQTANVLPAWQTLCFDSSKVGEAAAVAASSLSPAAFRLALPRPPPEVEAFLLSHWRAPLMWLTAEGQPRLRLTPRIFRALLAPVASGAAEVEPEELFALASWLRRVGRVGSAVVVDGDSQRLRVSRRSSGFCVVLEEGLSSKTSVSAEGVDAIVGAA